MKRKLMWGDAVMHRRHAHSLVRISTLLCVVGSTALSPAFAKSKCDLKEGATAEQARLGLCKFDVATRSFEGTPAEQAACLTRAVMRTAHIGDDTISPFLKDLVGKPAPSIKAVQSYLDGENIKSQQIGGPIATPIKANYFIIHDTSSPNCSEFGAKAPACPKRGKFPPDRDEASWPINKNFDGHPAKAPHRFAHAFTNRVGESVTEVDFKKHFVTTKFEQCVDPSAKIALFVGVENIQPRIGDPPIPKPGKDANDFDAPEPGFTTKQYDRLALLYLVASARRGQWLIPAFHAVIDQKYRDAHDDPQHFDMPAFSAAVQRHVEALRVLKL